MTPLSDDNERKMIFSHSFAAKEILFWPFMHIAKLILSKASFSSIHLGLEKRRSQRSRLQKILQTGVMLSGRNLDEELKKYRRTV